MIEVDPLVLWSSMAAVALAAASVPIAFSIRQKGKLKDALRFLPWISVFAVISIMFGVTDVYFAGVNVHHIAEALLISVIALFSLATLKGVR
jgi:hypothetical protein